ncbi:centromere protein C isoform X1 [Manis pentadactyla]|uniref:centromere protein C isoform X1 n=1 Tax=Manis pentadactyla TaxID=143292 RepID=UPI00255CD9A3|nr:centromere protein C isoform X1 [Manis pentadactyla]KAI5278893.1 Centromere Protein C [Manis pentadactyla]
MAASGLDHLKNDYRRRFCRPSRTPNISTKQGQNILEILQDCFEEKSLADDYCTNSTKSVLYSTPKIKDMSIQSPSKEAQCQKSHPKSVPVSSRKKEASLQFIVEPHEAIDKSVQAHDVHQKVLATDVGSKNTPDSRKMSSKKLKDQHPEADEDFYLSVGSPSILLGAKTATSQNAIPSIVQKIETYALENSVNTLSLSTEIARNTRKRLNFEDKDILKKLEIASKVEVEDKLSEGPQERKQSRTSHKRVQDSEYDIQPESKKSFSTLFLETVKRKSESSSIVRHIATAPLHSSPVNDMKLLEDEFIIDESDRSFASQSWLTVPRNAGPLKQRTVSPPESTALLQKKKSREKHHNILPTTLTSDKDSGKAYPVEKSQPSEQKKLSRSFALSDEMENNCRSTKYEMYSKNAEKSSGNKRTIKQKQKRKFKATIVDKQVDTEQSKGKNRNISPIIQDNLQRNSNKNTEQCKEMENVRSSKKQMPPVGGKKSSINILDAENLKRNSNRNKKRFSNESKNNKLVTLEEVTLTVTRSQRISRSPSNWWVVKSEQGPVDNSSRRNELSLNQNSRQKPAEKTNQSSKNIRKKNVPLKGQKRTTPRSSRARKSLNTNDSEGIIDHDEISGSQNESLEKDEADLAKKKNLDHPGVTGSPKDQDSILNSQIPGYTCKTPADSNFDSGEPETSVLEGSGPSRLKNYLMSGKNNSDVDDKEVEESSGDSRVKKSKVTPENKIHHKLVLPSNTPNVRRTKRIRLKPLEYWRGERIDYQGRPSGGFVIGGILSPDTVSSKRKAKENMGKVNKVVHRKRICLDNDQRKNKLVVNLNVPLGDPLKPTSVKDPDTREIILMDLIRPRDTYQFFVEHGDLKVYKTLDTPFFSTGKLVLGPHQEKGKQHVGLDTLVFYVDFGDLLCTLHETSYIITTGDSFYIPSGNYYNIKNLLNEESVLLFTQIKR